MMFLPIPRLKTPSDGGYGFRRMMSGSAGSTPNASAGNPSVTRFIHRICNGSSGSGMPRNGATSITQISPELQC